MKVIAIIPFKHNTTFEVIIQDSKDKEDKALWFLNEMRAHDGFEPLEELPKETLFRDLI